MSAAPSVTLDSSTRHADGSLELLSQVHLYAREFQRSPWDFAIDIASLRIAGFTDNDLRWLVLNGYLEHARELPMTNGKTRQFVQFGSLRFTERSCFVPTDAGTRLATMGTAQAGYAQDEEVETCDPPCAGSELRIQPTWDAVKQELRLGQEIVKSFKHPSVSQTVILSAFEESKWPARIDDPLPHPGYITPQMHLQEVVDCLNSNQRKRLIHFVHDETGRGVIWKHAEQDPD